MRDDIAQHIETDGYACEWINRRAALSGVMLLTLASDHKPIFLRLFIDNLNASDRDTRRIDTPMYRP